MGQNIRLESHIFFKVIFLLKETGGGDQFG